MKALLKNDIIISFSGDTEIGAIPKDVGIERLRFDGEKVVDLADLTQFWVEKNGDRFVLHCIEVPGSYSVDMQYTDRKYLVENESTIRLKTPEEIAAENAEKIIFDAKMRLSSKFGNYIDIQLAQLALLCALIVYARQQPAQLASFFDSIIPHIKDIFPLDRWQDLLIKFSKDLKDFLTEYYTDIDKV